MTRMSVLPLLAAAVSTATLMPRAAHANERHFTYAYETATLPAGAAEFEPWTTWRVGRDRYYNAFDNRLEFEYGITDRLQSALYLNFSAVAANDPETGERHSSFDFKGISSEWKLQVLDPVADALGLGFYGEITGARDELKLEAKVLFDKRIGNLLFAANLVFEPEFEFEQEAEMNNGVIEYHNETEVEYEIGSNLAVAYFISDELSLGLEMRTHTEVHEGEHEHTAFFAGPSMSYAAESYWLALSVLPQIGAAGEADGVRDLEEHEMLNARLLLGFHL